MIVMDKPQNSATSANIADKTVSNPGNGIGDAGKTPDTRRGLLADWIALACLRVALWVMPSRYGVPLFAVVKAHIARATPNTDPAHPVR